MKRLEFTGISAVWSREFDPQGISVIDLETRLDNIETAQEVTNATASRAKIDRSTENLISFKVTSTNR